MEARVLSAIATITVLICNVNAGGYQVKIFTSWDWWAGTDAWVFIDIYGQSRSTPIPRKWLDGAGGNFEKGSVFTYDTDNVDVGLIHRVYIGHNNQNWFPEWKLDKIEIYDKQRNQRYSFTCYCWLQAWPGQWPQRNLYRQVAGGWSGFGALGACSKSCGGGERIRYRKCNNPTPMHGGPGCHGNDYEKQACNTQGCPVDGRWGNWGDWSICSVTCDGAGRKTRSRSCNNPAPQHGGSQCVGAAIENKACNTGASCPVHGGWGDWGNFSTCTKSCGGGTQNRNRKCDNPAPANGGNSCGGEGTETRECATQPCPIDGGWGDWTDWSMCSVTCGSGNLTRSRVCNNPTPQYGGKQCQGQEVEMTTCSKGGICPVDGGWSDWSVYGPCSQTCEGGIKIKTRKCDNPSPVAAGAPCQGNDTESQVCGEIPCPDPCTTAAIKAVGFYGDANNCRVYYQCSFGKSYPKCCQPGLGWDKNANLCADRTCTADCSNPTLATSKYTTPLPTTTIPPGVCFDSDGNMKKPVDNDQYKYIKWNNGIKYTLTCGNGQLGPMLFNKTQCDCVEDTTATQAPDTCISGGVKYKLHPSGDTKKYIMIWHGEIEKTCPAGFNKFDLDLCRCLP